MTGDHVRRALILVFLFNLVMVFQNWQSSQRIDQMEKTVSSMVEMVNDAKKSEKSLIDSHSEINEKLDRLLTRPYGVK